MDCYSVESEFIESLDFLSPPVKRHPNSRETFDSPYNNEPSNVHLLRGLRNKFARRTPSSTKNTRTVKTAAESSTSLILKRTSERKILEHYSIVSYTSLQQPEDDIHSHQKLDRSPSNSEKPLIQVTVIPKTNQVQTAKILRKRRYIPKRVQSTTSNHENSVQTKNVYLIVAGRRREKIYEIKTTGSAKFSTEHDSYSKDEEIPIKEISNFKHLIQSMNMDRKKKKEKKAHVVNLDTPQQTSSEWKGGYPECQDCMCKDETKDDPQTPKKSRVRIFGQFGISEDDKYVLRYGATVNDKQVLSDVAQLTRDFSPIIAARNTYETPYDEDPKRQKDSCIQADCDNQLDFEHLAATDNFPSKESQGTQVNFNVQIASVTQGKSEKFLDKKNQCSCCAVANRSDHNKGLKACQSPLVIISVYPKPSPEDITKSVPTPKENIRCPPSARMNTYTSNQVLKIDKGTRRSNIETRRNIKSPSISRSPSPTKNISRIKMQEDKLIETKVMKNQVTEKKSPDRQKALRAIKDKIQEKDKIKQDAGTRKPSKFNTSYGTQVSKNLENITTSNATQVSNKNQQLTSSNGTQVSARNRQNYTVSNATQYSKNPQHMVTSNNATQCVDSPQNIAPVKHSKNTITSVKNLQNVITPNKYSQSSNATQVSKTPQHLVVSNATQVSKNEHLTASNATQVSKNQQNFIASRISKNQETFTAPYQVFKNEQTTNTRSKLQERGTNTDHARAKKALVETYTKKLTEQMNQKDFIPARYDTSKVTINIDGDKEYYDVLFNQDKLTTDLTIRKTLKEMASQKGYEDECSASLENFMYLPECEEAKGGPGNKSPTKSMSIALYNTRSDDEVPLAKHVSRVTIRDSLEISHRREDKSTHNNNNIKNTQTCFTAQLTENSPDETEFLAPIKHFTGDDCSICDPIERDKQIRELLGVDKTRLTYSKTQQAHHSTDDAQYPYQCIYRQECKKSQVTEINFQFQKLCPCLKPMHRSKGKSVPRTSVSVQCRHTRCCSRGRYNHNHNHNRNNYAYDEDEETYGNGDENETYATGEKCCISPLRFSNGARNFSNENYDNDEQYSPNEHCCMNGKYPPDYNGYNNDEHNQNGEYNMPNDDDEKRYDSKENPAIYQQLILNRNIQVFLQVEQFSKQKPILLSRKQYNKVKKTIQKTICKKKSSHDKRKKYVCNKCERSEVSVGEVRKKRGKDPSFLIEQEAQTDLVPCCKESCRNSRNKSVMKENKFHHIKSSSKQTSTDQSEEQFSGGDHDEENPEKTGSLSEYSRERIKSRSWKRGRSKERCCKSRSKRTVDQNVGVVTIDKFSGHASWCSQHSEKKKETQKEKVRERIAECSVERNTKRNVECNADRNNENKGEHGPKRYNEQKGERGPERYIQQKQERSPERYSEQVGYPSPGRYSEKVGCPSPEKISENIGRSSPERYNDPNKAENLEKDSEQNVDLNVGVVEQKETEVKTLILYNADDTKAKLKNEKESDKGALTRRTMSSVEIRYASVAYMKQIAYSSTDVGALSDSSIAHANSFHTIFRGHRKSPTPNLGTSAYSLYSEEAFNYDNKSAKFIMEPRDSKPKKPFLRRLMSCLVMRSTRDSELKLPTGPAPDLPSVNSSIDSYHISTSLGAVEVSSSIYDTSASFYSNHTILPVNSKIKRGFFSSVRGFLTNRKS